MPAFEWYFSERVKRAYNALPQGVQLSPREQEQVSCHSQVAEARLDPLPMQSLTRFTPVAAS